MASEVGSREGPFAAGLHNAAPIEEMKIRCMTGAMFGIEKDLSILVLVSEGSPAPYQEFMPNTRNHPELKIRRMELFQGNYKNDYLYILIFNRNPKQFPDAHYLKYLAQFMLWQQSPYKELNHLVELISPSLTGPELFLEDAPEVA